MAHPNVIPVVTATWPKRLNLLKDGVSSGPPPQIIRIKLLSYHPVIQEAKAECFGGANSAAQKYGPPLVGIAETISAIPRATIRVKNDTQIHPIDIVPGPPVLSPYENRVVIPVITLCKNREKLFCLV